MRDPRSKRSNACLRKEKSGKRAEKSQLTRVGLTILRSGSILVQAQNCQDCFLDVILSTLASASIQQIFIEVYRIAVDLYR